MFLQAEEKPCRSTAEEVHALQQQRQQLQAKQEQQPGLSIYKIIYFVTEGI